MIPTFRAHRAPTFDAFGNVGLRGAMIGVFGASTIGTSRKRRHSSSILDASGESARIAETCQDLECDTISLLPSVI